MSKNFVAHLKRYISISDEDIDILTKNIQTVSVKKKHYLLKGGQVCKSHYFVGKGCLRMFFINDKGTEQITQFALEGWWISDYTSMTMGVKSEFYIQAIEDSEILVINYKKLEDLLEQIPLLERYFRIMMQRAYAAAQMRVKFFHDYSKEENYRHFVAMFPAFVQRIPQYMLASYLGLTPNI